MVETELKFQVPAAARAAVHRALGTARAQTLRLRAAYADTPDERLAAAAMVLRLRQEGRVWVQTLKGRGDGLLNRLEHEVPLPAQRGTPVLDPARHAGTPAGDALARLLADGAPLQERYRTDIRRLLRRVRSGGAVVEIALDEGRILAGARSAPVCELEFELVSGPPQALLALAERWVRRHGLWLDVRTKSERGQRLAAGDPSVPATRAPSVDWPAEATTATVFGAALQAALAQVLPNAAALADGAGGAEHLHQCRAGLRRLRTVLRLLAPWSPDPPAALALEWRWRVPFQALGVLRDADVRADVLAGIPVPASLVPALPPTTAPALDAAALLRQSDWTVLVLHTLQLMLATPSASPRPVAGHGTLHLLLQAPWRQALQAAATFADAAPEARHRLRRRLKRLRGLIDLLRPVLRAKAAGRVSTALGRTLDLLGRGRDVELALQHLQALAPQTPATGFAAGWLTAQQAKLERRTRGRLQRLARLPRCWP